MTKTDMTDTELDALLKQATQPQLPQGAIDRMAARLGNELSNSSNVVALRPRLIAPAPQSRLGWLTALPLAASLAFGLYLGLAEPDSNLLTTYANDLIAATGNIDDPITGIDEVELLVEENQS